MHTTVRYELRAPTARHTVCATGTRMTNGSGCGAGAHLHAVLLYFLHKLLLFEAIVHRVRQTIAAALFDSEPEALSRGLGPLLILKKLPDPCGGRLCDADGCLPSARLARLARPCGRGGCSSGQHSYARAPAHESGGCQWSERWREGGYRGAPPHSPYHRRPPQHNTTCIVVIPCNFLCLSPTIDNCSRFCPHTARAHTTCISRGGLLDLQL